MVLQRMFPVEPTCSSAARAPLLVRELGDADKVVLADGPDEFMDLATGVLHKLGEILGTLCRVSEVLDALLGPVDQGHAGCQPRSPRRSSLVIIVRPDEPQVKGTVTTPAARSAW